MMDPNRVTTATELTDPPALVAYLQVRREAERTRLSRMLHHDVAGMLAAARMDLSRLISHAPADSDLPDQLRRVDQLLEQVIRDARLEMQRLHPALIDHFGLPMALRHLIEDTCRGAGVQYTMEFAETVEGLEPPIPIAVFRLVEALLRRAGTLKEFEARLTSRRDNYLLELVCIPSPSPAAAGDADGNEDEIEVLALRNWLQSLGVSWQQSWHEGATTIEMRVPRTIAIPPPQPQAVAPGA